MGEARKVTVRRLAWRALRFLLITVIWVNAIFPVMLFATGRMEEFPVYARAMPEVFLVSFAIGGAWALLDLVFELSGINAWYRRVTGR